MGSLEQSGARGEDLMAWMGPAIGPAAYEVDDPVYRALVQGPGGQEAFSLNPQRRWQLDLYAVARARLEAAGVGAVYGGGFCTARDDMRFFSHRRQGSCGRQAALIWLENT